MRLLAIDVGNTRTKMEMLTDQGPRPYDGGAVDGALASVTGPMPDWEALLPGVEVELLSAATRLPVGLDYATPSTLGPDRIAAACGAWSLRPGERTVVVDAGTCITIDYVDEHGCYRGGAILPGIGMKFRALHTFTAKLPLLNITGTPNLPANGITGKSTEESMAAGVIEATRMEVEGFARRYEGAEVLLTGGDADLIGGPYVRVDGLVMRGLFAIMKMNH